LPQSTRCEQVEAKVARKSYTSEDVQIIDHSGDEYEYSQQLSMGSLDLAVSLGDCASFMLGFCQDRKMNVENGEITLT